MLAPPARAEADSQIELDSLLGNRDGIERSVAYIELVVAASTAYAVMTELISHPIDARAAWPTSLFDALAAQVRDGHDADAVESLIHTVTTLMRNHNFLGLTHLIGEGIASLSDLPALGIPEEQFDLYLTLLALARKVRGEVPAWQDLANLLKPTLEQRFAERSSIMLQGIVD
jgi:hypothetical protein